MPGRDIITCGKLLTGHDIEFSARHTILCTLEIRPVTLRMSANGVRCAKAALSRRFAARQNLVAIGVIADIERATPIERDL